MKRLAGQRRLQPAQGWGERTARPAPARAHPRAAGGTQPPATDGGHLPLPAASVRGSGARRAPTRLTAAPPAVERPRPGRCNRGGPAAETAAEHGQRGLGNGPLLLSAYSSHQVSLTWRDLPRTRQALLNNGYVLAVGDKTCSSPPQR